MLRKGAPRITPPHHARAESVAFGTDYMLEWSLHWTMLLRSVYRSAKRPEGTRSAIGVTADVDGFPIIRHSGFAECPNREQMWQSL
jgi:hypothetical protein